MNISFGNTLTGRFCEDADALIYIQRPFQWNLEILQEPDANMQTFHLMLSSPIENLRS